MAFMWVVLFCCLFVVSFAQTRPSLSSSFYARVRVNLIDAQKESWLGGGVYGFDAHSGFKKLQYTVMREGKNESAFYHTLSRYDLGQSYSIDISRKCEMTPVNGNLETPFKWVENATLTAQSADTETWEYSDNEGVQHKIVIKKGTNAPVFFTQILDDKVTELKMTVLEWHTEVPAKIRTYIPSTCQGYDILQASVSDVVAFADANWNCVDVACTQTVPSGSSQEGYACAEFTARSLAAGAFIPGLGPTDPQGSYSSWGYNGNTYSLIECSGLNDALASLGFVKMANQASSVTAGCAAIGDGGDGPMSHAVIGVGPGIDDAHNNARYHWQVSGSLYGGVDAVWCPPGTPSSGTAGTSSTSSTSSSSYYSVTAEAREMGAEQGGNGVIYDTKSGGSDARHGMRLVEERAARKFE